MGRPSKLTDLQWKKIGERLVGGESVSALAREFKIGKSTISERFSERTETIKTVAQQLVAAERSLSSLNIPEQSLARNLADKLISISGHLAGAAEFGAATAHRLSGIAASQSEKIDDAEPEKSMEALGRIGVLTKMANASAEIGLNLLASNKDAVKKINDLNEREELDAAQESTLPPEEAYLRMIG